MRAVDVVMRMWSPQCVTVEAGADLGPPASPLRSTPTLLRAEGDRRANG
jgi:hypothetical protein